jgi:predicted TIM-barrel fold metal-dependent hydrolase
LATYFSKRGSGLSNYRLLKHIEHIPQAYMLASLDFEYYYFQHINEVIELMNEEKVLGTKIYSGYQNIDYDSKKFKDIMEISKNKIVMFHTGFCHNMKLAFNPMILENIIKEYSETKFVLSHLANPFSKEIIYLLNTYKNVFSDISGLIEKEIDRDRAFICFNEVINGVEDKTKILFGTDYPIQNFEDTIEILGNHTYILENKII